MQRRRFLINTLSLSALAAMPASLRALAATPASPEITPLMKTKQEWKKLLPAESYAVLFEEDTEHPNTSALLHEKRAGRFICAACYLPLFDASAKFESGTGWPSFFQPLKDAVATKRDFKLIWPRTEYHCARCGGHQGHMFEDGPAPTGLRYCNNGLALNFVAEGQPLPALRV